MFTQEDVIFSYTRKQALADGSQTLLEGEHADMAKQAGWKYPVYLTQSVVTLINIAVDNPKCYNDFKGILWDILFMASLHAKACQGDTFRFKVIITGTGRKRNHIMVAKIGPTDFDNPEPAITIMFPEDD